MPGHLEKKQLRTCGVYARNTEKDLAVRASPAGLRKGRARYARGSQGQ
jgi:hypothetical protein